MSPYVRFDKMMGILLPVFVIHRVIFAVQIQLIHAKNHGEILGLPLFLVRIAIFHAQILHHAAAAGVVYVMRGGDKRHTAAAQVLQQGPARLRGDSLMPEFPSKGIAKVMAFVVRGLDVADGLGLLLQTDGEKIGILPQLVKKDFDKLVDGGPSSPVPATPTSFC